MTAYVPAERFDRQVGAGAGRDVLDLVHDLDPSPQSGDAVCRPASPRPGCRYLSDLELVDLGALVRDVERHLAGRDGRRVQRRP